MWAVGGVVAIAVIAAGAGSGSSPSDPAAAASVSSGAAAAAPSEAAPAQAAPAEAAPAGVGSAVRDGKFEFVVQGVDRGQTQIGTEYLNNKAQGEFVLVTVNVTNVGDQPQSFIGGNAKLFDSAGREFSASTEAAIYLQDSNSLYEEINPGNTVTGTLVFDIPSATALDRLELHDSMFSGGVTVKL